MPKSKRLSDESLGWIKDTSDSETNTSLPKIKSVAKSNDLKKVVTVEKEKPSIPVSSSPISKGTIKATPMRRVAVTESEKTASVKDLKKVVTAKKVIPGIPVSSFSITKGTTIVAPMRQAEVTEIKKTAPVKDLKKKALSKSKNKPLVKAKAVKKTVAAKKVVPGIPEPSFSILKKQAKAAQAKTGKVVEIAKSKTAGILVSIKKVSGKFAITVPQAYSSDAMKKTLDVTIAAIKHPLDTVSSIDKKITKSMKKGVSAISKNVGDNVILNNLISTDRYLTKSVKEFVDSIVQ